MKILPTFFNKINILLNSDKSIQAGRKCAVKAERTKLVVNFYILVFLCLVSYEILLDLNITERVCLFCRSIE